MPYVLVSFCFQIIGSESCFFLSYADIGGTVDHHCLNFLYIIHQLKVTCPVFQETWSMM
jgi:hypothetical protein